MKIDSIRSQIDWRHVPLNWFAASTMQPADSGDRHVHAAKLFTDQRRAWGSGAELVFPRCASCSRWAEVAGGDMASHFARFGARLTMASLSTPETAGQTVKHPTSPHPGLRIALAQLDLEDGNLPRNMELAEHAVRAAVPHRPDFLCLPEASDFGWLHQHARRDALSIPGPYTDFLAGIARSHRIWISAGCLEKVGDQIYNSAVILDRDGRLVHKHRKIETLPELTSHIYDRGRRDTPTTLDTEFGRIGLTICADNFDITIPQKAARAGAWLLIAPHGFAAAIERMETNAREYADHIERVATGTGMWVAAANVALGRVKGGDWKGQMHCGCSRVVRPDGTVAAVGKFRESDLVLCDIPPA